MSYHLAAAVQAAAPQKYLLDVNALIAALTLNHPDHRKTDAWLTGKVLVTCPLSELGYLRISTNPKALNLSMATARRMLGTFITKRKVEFVPADVPALKSVAQNSEQITDQYLAQLVANKGLKLATLDQRIQHSAAEIIV